MAVGSMTWRCQHVIVKFYDQFRVSFVLLSKEVELLLSIQLVCIDFHMPFFESLRIAYEARRRQ